MGKIAVQKKITDFYQAIKPNKNKLNKLNKSNLIIRGYNSETYDYHCLVCGISMGPNNPRQLCRKTWCPNE
jgi:hypothetical protein